MGSGLSPPLSPPRISSLRGGSPPYLRGPGDPQPINKEADPIKMAVLVGRQELKLKIKQSDELPGPKVLCS